MSKPQVFKMGGAWVWRCRHSEDRLFTQDFPVSAWSSPWDAALSDATRHTERYHVEVQAIEP